VWLARDAAGPTPEPGIQTIEALSDLPELLVSEYRTPTLAESQGVDFRLREGVV